jgi:3',5'-cyclic AMP phosphodiesterase CpdA
MLSQSFLQRGVELAKRPSIDGILVAQVTDLHIGFDRDNPHELNVRRLNMVIDELNEMRPKPSLLLVTGDLVESADDLDAYRHMKSLIARWEGPVVWALGNHDSRENFRTVLPEVPTDPNGFIQYEVDHGDVRWIVLDTLDSGRHGGMVCEQRADWLEERLKERTDTPTIIVLHHPPVDTGIDWMSALSCEAWVQRLEAVLEPAKQVVALIAGHVHRPIATSFAGKPLAVCCSTAPWVALNLEDIDPKDPDGRALILGDAPAYALHYWNGERLLTHFDIAGPRHVLASYDSNAQPMIRDFLNERGTG